MTESGVRITTPGPEEPVTPGGAHCLRSRWVFLAPGKCVGEHSTEDKEEVLVILTGTATVEVAGEAHRVSAPAAVFIPPHTQHNVRNSGDSTLVYVYITGKLLPP